MENNSNHLKKSKNKKIIIIILIFLALFLVINLLTKDDNKNDNKIVENNNEDIFVASEDENRALTPEEVIARMNKEEGIGVEQGPVDVEIISPKGEYSILSQSRLYEAKILGIESGSRCSCDWKFYINENNEEYLYKEMSDLGCSRKTSAEVFICGFTSTFIDKLGELRVHVDVKIEKQGNIVQTSAADRIYIIKAYD